MSNNVKIIDNDVSNYEIPVFPISELEINSKTFSKISLNSIKFKNEFKTVNYNNNCIRWIRKVELKDINGIKSSNPYFTNPPENEYHLCSLYLTPGNYKSREEIINQINNELNKVRNTLFNQENQIKNSYLQYNYTGNISQSIILYETLLNSGKLIYPSGSNISNIYTNLILLIQLSGKSYNFDDPVLIRNGTYDIYNDLYLMLDNSNSNGLNNYSSLWSTYNSYEKMINQLKTLQGFNNKYVSIYEPNLETIYGINQGLYEFRNGFSMYTKLHELDSDQQTIYKQIVNIIYDPDENDSKCVLKNNLEFFIELGFGLFNYICNFIYKYENTYENTSELNSLKSLILQICRKLNIYEIDSEFINNFINITKNNSEWEAGKNKIYKSVANRFVIRLLNNFIVSIIIEKSLNPNNLNDEDIKNKISDFNSKIVSIINQLLIFDSQFDLLDDSENSFWNKWVDNPTDIYPAYTSKINPLQIIIKSYSEEYDQIIYEIIKSSINLDDSNSPISILNRIIKLNLEPGSSKNQVCTYNLYENNELSKTINLTSESIDIINENINKFNFTIPDAIMETDNSTVLSISANDLDDLNKYMKMTSGKIAHGSIKYLKYIGNDDLLIPCVYEQNGVKYNSISMKNNDTLAFQKFIYLSSNMIQLTDGIINSSDTSININSKNILENMIQSTSIIQDQTLKDITLKTSMLLNDSYFEKLNDSSLIPFQLINQFGNEYLQSNIGKLIFIELDSNLIVSNDNYGKTAYYGKSNPYLYVRDLYNSNLELTKNPTKLCLYENQNLNIPNDFYKYNQFKNNLISRMGLDHWIINSSDINKPFIKTSNYSETIFYGNLQPKFNIVNLNNSISLKSNIVFNNLLLNQLFGIISSNLIQFISELSLLKPHRIIICTSNNSNIEKIINENINSTNRIYEFIINESDSQFNGKFSTDIQIELNSEKTYVFAYSEDQPYAITNGLSELEIQYLE